MRARAAVAKEALARPTGVRAADLDLVELLDFAPERGRIGLGNQRLLLWDADAFGNLRRELVDGLGLDAARGILRRFGFASGFRDALSTRELGRWSSDREWWLTCPALQAHEGKVRPHVRSLELDRAVGRFELEVEWHDSYEAEQHLRVRHAEDFPVCWTLAGYASGFASAVMGEEVFVVEEQCRAAGHAACRVVGRTRAAWGERAEQIAGEYRAPDLARELHAREDELRAAAAAVRAREDAVARRERALTGEGPCGAAMATVLERVDRVAAVDTTVLVCGESGVGKERIARRIHERSPRHTGPLVTINCGALPEALLESELFGHVRGAFTGAVADAPGLFVAARGGTVFLDEIGELSPATQVKLLRVLQERVVRPVGGAREAAVDVRIVAATHRDLAELVAAGRFRQDLYYRLKVVPIEVPPLRDRADEILPLARHFVEATCARYGRKPRVLTAEVAALLERHRWPGNVRELQHAMEHAVVLAGDEPRLAAEHLPAELRDHPEAPVARLLGEDLPLEELERRYTLLVLARHGGSRGATARALGIGANTLWRKLKRWGVSESQST